MAVSHFTVSHFTGFPFYRFPIYRYPIFRFRFYRLPCVQAVGCGLTGLAVQFSDESALVVCNTWYALHKSTFLPYLTLPY